MFRHSLALIALLGIAGCQASTSISSPFGKGKDQEQRTQRAAFAASAQYPKEMKATTDLPASALINRDQQTIRIVNSSDRALRDVTVWVNGSYVAKVDTIPSHGIVTLRHGDFYDGAGTSLANQKPTITRVELQSQDKLYALQGPVFE
jgi:hypothetical protein